MALFETSYNLPDLHKYSFRLGNRATHCTSTNIIMSYTVIMLLNELIDVLKKNLYSTYLPCVNQFKQFTLVLVTKNLKDNAKVILIHYIISFMLSTKKRHTWIFEDVFGSRKDFTEFHSSLKPGPAFTMNIRPSVCKIFIPKSAIFQGHTYSLINVY